MSGFSKARGVEAEAMRRLIPYARNRFGDVVPTEGQLVVQKYCGDVIVPMPRNNGSRFIEVKAETKNKTGNLFLETWSNRSRFTTGWLFTSNADGLWYYFLEEDELYEASMQDIKVWAFGGRLGETEVVGSVYRFAERVQKKYDQLNDTWGRCVPISILQSSLKRFRGPIKVCESFCENITDTAKGIPCCT